MINRSDLINKMPCLSASGRCSHLCKSGKSKLVSECIVKNILEMPQAETLVIRELKIANAKIESDLIVSLRKNERLIDSFKSLKKSFWKRLKFLFCPKGI